VDSIFSRFTTRTPGCAVGVSRHGQTLLTRGYGMSNLEYGVPLDSASVMESGSVAKQFTSAAVVLLQHDGKLSLDDDIRKHLPEVPDFGATITIRMLLTHTSGLRDQWGLLALTGNPPTMQVHTLPLILHLVSRQRELNFPPGSEYLYSNTGYALAAMIVQRVSGVSLAAFSRQRLFEPLGMTDTQWRDDFERVVPRRATAYDWRGASYAQNMPFTNVYGNGGLLSTMRDLLIWNEALSTGTVPGGKALVEQLETRGRLTGGQTIAYALGLTHGTWRGHREISHGGSTAGYRTYLTRFPDARVSIAVWCNVSNANPTALAYDVAARLLPAREPATTETAVDSVQGQPLVGRYRNPATDAVLDVGLRPTGLTANGLPVRKQEGALVAANGARMRFDPSTSPRRLQTIDSDGVSSEWVELVAESPANVGEFAGRYKSPELDVVYEIRLEGSQLSLVFPPTPAQRLNPLYPDGFSAGNQTLRFYRDPAGRVVGFRVMAGRVRNLRFERQ
jgi:CubicO group peptidase (beta-lactamase class C family)